MDYTAFWNGCQTANERKVKSMRNIEEIVRTILNSDALMEKVNHVVEIERMKYNRGWSTETDIDNFSPIGFRKVVTSAMNLLGLQNESDEVDIASEILKDIFRNEIIKKDGTYLPSQIEQYRSLLSRLAIECDNEKLLRGVVIFMADLNDEDVIDYDGIYRLVKKGGAR